jgi:hypothetical protein
VGCGFFWLRPCISEVLPSIRQIRGLTVSQLSHSHCTEIYWDAPSDVDLMHTVLSAVAPQVFLKMWLPHSFSCMFVCRN